MSTHFQQSLVSTCSLIPHVLLVVVSGIFSGFFFWELGETALQSSVYLTLAVALESAKVFFLWRTPETRSRKLARAAMVMVLAVFSVMASVSFSINSISGERIARDQALQKAEDYTRLIEQKSEQIEALQAKLEKIPKEWRITKNEYVDQLERLTGEQRELIAKRAEAREQEQAVVSDRAGFWLKTAGALEVDEEQLLLGVMIALAVILEFAIAGTRVGRQPDTDNGQCLPNVASREVDLSELPVDITRYAETVLNEEPNTRPMSLRESARYFAISVRNAAEMHRRLRALGVLHTNRTHSEQLVTKEQALVWIGEYRSRVAA